MIRYPLRSYDDIYHLHNILHTLKVLRSQKQQYQHQHQHPPRPSQNQPPLSSTLLTKPLNYKTKQQPTPPHPPPPPPPTLTHPHLSSPLLSSHNIIHSFPLIHHPHSLLHPSHPHPLLHPSFPSSFSSPSILILFSSPSFPSSHPPHPILSKKSNCSINPIPTAFQTVP